MAPTRIFNVGDAFALTDGRCIVVSVVGEDVGIVAAIQTPGSNSDRLVFMDVPSRSLSYWAMSPIPRSAFDMSEVWAEVKCWFRLYRNTSKPRTYRRYELINKAYFSVDLFTEEDKLISALTETNI